MRIKIDLALCQGHSVCLGEAPEVFDVIDQDDGYPHVKVLLENPPEELREKVFKNMSQRAAEMLREDLEAKGPVRLSEVEAEQKEILKVARRLAEEGQMVLGGKGSEDAFV